MATGGHDHGSGPLGELKWFFLVLIVLWIVWYYTGGPERFRESTPFIKPLPPLDSGQTYGPGTQFVDPIK